MLFKGFAGLVVFALASSPVADCVCFLEGTLLGAHKGKFTATFVSNPNPEPGQGHGSAPCSSMCNPMPSTGCKVNGTLTITNNSTWDIVVNWSGNPGGTPIAAGATGSFATGVVTLYCGKSDDINFRAGANGVVAHYQFKCNSCAVPAQES
jgi:hypothetical protein